MKSLKSDLSIILRWFASNQLVANPAKFQMIVLGVSSVENIYINLDNIILKPSTTVKLLGITIDSKLSFKEHILDLCKKANWSVRCLFRIRKFLIFNQSKLLLNSFIISHFNYAPIFWMFCNKTIYTNILALHKRSLRALCQNFDCDYDELLSISNTNSIHELHLRYLATEIYKTLNGLNPEFLKAIFICKITQYNLRKQNLLLVPRAKSTSFGTLSFAFRGSLLWNSLSDQVKNSPSLYSFKKKLDTICLSQLCGCKICK